MAAEDQAKTGGVLGALRSLWDKAMGGRPTASGSVDEVKAAPAPTPAPAPAPTPVPERTATAAPADEPLEEPTATVPEDVPSALTESAADPAPEDVPLVGAEQVAAEPQEDSPFLAPVPEDAAEALPDASWTVARLRALAKDRGVRGYSSMSKAQLLGELSGPQA